MEFWNEKSDDLTLHLWNPSLEFDHETDIRNELRCEHPHISCTYYYDDNVLIDNTLQFKEIPPVNNSTEKYKLENKLRKKELKRFSKEIDKVNETHIIDEQLIEESDKKLADKHYEMIDKIDIKVNNLDKFVRSYQTEILPNENQQKILHSWFYDCTCVYNKLVSHFTQIYQKYSEFADENPDPLLPKNIQLGKLLKNNEEFPLNFYKLRSLKITDYTEEYKSTPYCVLTDTIKEFVENTKGNITKMIENQITEFAFKHRKFNRKQKTLTIESHYTGNTGFYPSILKEIETKDKTFSWGNIEHDYKLIYDKYKKKFIIHVPKYIDPKEHGIRQKIGVMDPGERTFEMLYGLDHVIEIGKGMRECIMKILKKIDDLKSKLDKLGKYKFNKKLGKRTKVKKWKFKRAIQRHHNKIDGIIRELHYKTAIYLCRNYDRIMVTDFSSGKVNSKKKNLDPWTKRVLGKLSHYKFRQRLKNKCEEYGCQYLEVGEAYTTKTCGSCGTINNIGANEIFTCTKCNNQLGRDVNAARNILIRNMEEVFV